MAFLTEKETKMLHILEEWRIRDVEQKAEQANRRLYELDSMRSYMDSLQHSNRELSARVDGLRATLDTALNRIEQLERTVEELTVNAEVTGA
jgi:archaellum component FlaC